ncbi:hypothetical protein JCM12294_42410 [Desulfocicer niacini]
MSYWYPSPQHGHEVKKTSFFFYDKTWNWAIGNGFYYDDLETQLAKIEKNINEKITKESIVTMGKMMLERLGYKVTPFTNSMDALKALTNDVEKFDVVIIDLSMPNLPGDKLASEILRIRPNMPIILNSGFNEKVSPETAEMIGIKGILIKPTTKAKRAQTIRKVLDNENKMETWTTSKKG